MAVDGVDPPQKRVLRTTPEPGITHWCEQCNLILLVNHLSHRVIICFLQTRQPLCSTINDEDLRTLQILVVGRYQSMNTQFGEDDNWLSNTQDHHMQLDHNYPFV
jgi:hypothetical protein